MDGRTRIEFVNPRHKGLNGKPAVRLPVCAPNYVPETCRNYNRGICYEDDCSRLHLCRRYFDPKMYCRKGKWCNLGHDIGCSQARECLRKAGFDIVVRPWMLYQQYNQAINSMGKERNKTVEKDLPATPLRRDYSTENTATQADREPRLTKENFVTKNLFGKRRTGSKNISKESESEKPFEQKPRVLQNAQHGDRPIKTPEVNPHGKVFLFQVTSPGGNPLRLCRKYEKGKDTDDYLTNHDVRSSNPTHMSLWELDITDANSSFGGVHSRNRIATPTHRYMSNQEKYSSPEWRSMWSLKDRASPYRGTIYSEASSTTFSGRSMSNQRERSTSRSSGSMSSLISGSNSSYYGSLSSIPSDNEEISKVGKVNVEKALPVTETPTSGESGLSACNLVHGREKDTPYPEAAPWEETGQGAKMPFEEVAKVVEVNGNPTNRKNEPSVNQTALPDNISKSHFSSRENADICLNFLDGSCANKDNCGNHHQNLPYLWQYEILQEGWKSFSDDNIQLLEESFSDVNTRECPLMLVGRMFRVNFDDMQATSTAKQFTIPARRLSTTSYVNECTGQNYITHWVWYWHTGTEWLKFGQKLKKKRQQDGTDIQRQLEQGYQREATGEITMKINGYKYKINFETMTQQNLKSGKERKITRRPVFASMEDVKNAPRKRRQMEQEYGHVGINQKKLFHGTCPEAVEAICKQNIDWRLYGSSTGSRFGQGAYFATSSYKAHPCTRQNNHGMRFMFLVRVLVGKFTKGNRTMRRPPPILPENPTKLFDSCTDDMETPTMFVVFDKEQYYPELEICYLQK